MKSINLRFALLGILARATIRTVLVFLVFVPGVLKVHVGLRCFSQFGVSISYSYVILIQNYILNWLFIG
jgi:hypothetical protein